LGAIISMFLVCSSGYAEQIYRSWSLEQCEERQEEAYNIRMAAADERAKTVMSVQNDNGDEALYNDKRGSFSKALPHDNSGLVDLNAYQSLIDAINSGDPADFDAIIMGGDSKLVNPQASASFSLVGADAAAHVVPPSPTFISAETAGEMVEVYWKSLLRDVKFSNYETNPLIGTAVADMNLLSDFKGPKVSGQLTRGTIFRGSGGLVGPYISQFLYLPVPFVKNVNQKRKSPRPNSTNNFLTTVDECLAIQNGENPEKSINFRVKNKFIMTGRDLGDWVHLDYQGEAFFNAALMLLSFGADALDDNNPYKNNPTQDAFITFGMSDVLTLVHSAANAAFKAVWHQKWNIHRRLRPEVYGFLVNQQLTTDGVDYNIHSDLLNSGVLEQLLVSHGNYLLFQQFPEGSPCHPAYPAGHAGVSGACATVLKAFFKEDFVIPNPKIPAGNGNRLVNYVGATLTVGRELTKLAENITLGRDWAGVHYRSDGYQGMLLGEKVAIDLLEDMAFTMNEDFAGFSLTKFDGTQVTVGAKKTV